MSRLRLRIVLIALAAAGLVVLLWLATAAAAWPGSAYRDMSRPDEPLFDGHQIGQVVAAPLDRLVAVRLWLRRPANPGNSVIALRVRSLDQGKDLAAVELPVASIAADGPTTFGLPALAAPPLQINRPETLELVLITGGVAQADPVGIGVGRNGYGRGLMVRDGQEITDADLPFEMLYRARLLDRFFPITAIADQRPGIFGWPPFYALLVYGVLILLGRFAYRVLRAAFGTAAGTERTQS